MIGAAIAGRTTPVHPGRTALADGSPAADDHGGLRLWWGKAVGGHMKSSAQGGQRFSGTSTGQVTGLAHGAVGPARVIAFGASNVAPAGSLYT